MKTDKFKISKKTIFLAEIILGVCAVCALSVYYLPQILHNKEVMAASKIKADNSVFISKSLEEFEGNKNAKPSEVAKKVSEELNSSTINPYNKKADAYTFETECKGCNSVEFDDVSEMIILTTYDKKGDLIARTVIKPPSFVTYNKDVEK